MGYDQTAYWDLIASAHDPTLRDRSTYMRAVVGKPVRSHVRVPHSAIGISLSEDDDEQIDA